MSGFRIGFAGAGGVGCYFGGLMSMAGLDVTLLGRGAHIANIERRGLQFDLNNEQHIVQVRTADTRNVRSLNQMADLDWLFITCKTYQTDALIEQIAPFLGKKTRIVSLQNGVDGPDVISKLLGRPVYGGLSIRFVAHVTAPGEVKASGNGYIQMGAYPQGGDETISAFGELLQDAGLDVRISDDIRRELWRKIVINNGVNPICALLRQDCGEVFSDAGTAGLVDQLMLETIIAARADDVQLTEQDIAELRSIIFGLGHVKPSMQVDREQGRPLELDAISGAVIARALRTGERAPVTETIYHLLKAEMAADDRMCKRRE